jgi:large subunit ribosomal protein L25
MQEMLVFSAERKKGIGRGVARELRRTGRIPAIVYERGGDNIMISLAAKDFLKEYLKGGIQSRLVELDIEGVKIAAVPKEVQTDPVSDEPKHIDFQKVNKDSAVKVAVRVKVINADKCIGVKKGGVANIVYRSIHCYCNPYNIPRSIEINIENLEIGRSIHIGDVSLPESVKPIDRTNFVLVSVSGRATEESKSSEESDSADKK